MTECFVAKASEFKDGSRKVVSQGNHEIGVFCDKGHIYAYSNFCLHQGGPACEGLIIAQVEEKLMDDMTSVGLRFNHQKLHFVCPWHGWEYDLETGECAADRRMKLRKYEVVTRGGDIYVVV